MSNNKQNIGLDFTQPVGRRRGADLAGMSFGRLTVDKFAGMAKGQSWWWCICECGTEVPVRTQCLLSEMTTSCGCYAREVASARHRTHGKSGTSEYRLWRGMVSRCHDPGSGSYGRYGARGISVCDEWRESFEKFLADVGNRPTPHHTLDRYPNKAGNYEPGNVRWATMKEQARNKTNNRVLEFNGKTMTVVEWAEELGVTPGTISQRLGKGWPVSDALTVPYGSHRSTHKKLQGKLTSSGEL